MREKIEAIENEIAALQEEMENFEIDPDDYENEYRNMLDELYEVNIGGISFSAANVLEDQDPTAYRCGLNDYVDGIDIEDTEEYKEMIEKLEDLEQDLKDLKEEDDDES